MLFTASVRYDGDLKGGRLEDKRANAKTRLDHVGGLSFLRFPDWPSLTFFRTSLAVSPSHQASNFSDFIPPSSTSLHPSLPQLVGAPL